MILVTGGLGYVGSFTCKFLSKKNKPFSIDNLSRGNSFSGKYCRNFKVNIGDVGKVSKIIKKNKIDTILHLAAYTCVRESNNKREAYKINNFVNQKKFLKTAIKNGVKKIIFSSSYCVENISQSKVAEISPYARYKYLIENYLKRLSKKRNIGVIIIRYPNISGASLNADLGEKNDKITRIFPTFYKKILYKKKIKLFYDPKSNIYPKRSYIHVEDIAYLNFKLIKYIAKMKKKILLFKVKNKLNYSNKDIYNIMSKKLNKKTSVELKKINITEKLTPSKFKINKNFNKINWKPKNSSLSQICNTNLKWFKKIYQHKPSEF